MKPDPATDRDQSRGGESLPARYHDLDALRAFALLLGVVCHAAESFMAGHESWAIVDRSPSLVLDLFRHGCHAFRLELFFVMAGFFARWLYHRRGGAAFWRNRLSRILVPLVVSLQIWVARWPASWVVKFGLINLAAFPVLFMSYHYLVRSTIIGQQLNGRRYPFEVIFLRAFRDRNE